MQLKLHNKRIRASRAEFMALCGDEREEEGTVGSNAELLGICGSPIADYGERFVDFWTSRQPRPASATTLLGTTSKQQQEEEPPLWDYSNSVMDKRCNHDELLDLNQTLLDEPKNLLPEDYPCHPVHNKVIQQLPELLGTTWTTPSYSEDVFSQEYLLGKVAAAEKLSNSKVGTAAAQQQQPTNGVAGQTNNLFGLPVLQGIPHPESSCSSDCPVLVNTICNLSKVLLSHHSSPASESARQLQLALFNLSRCLLRVHGAEEEQLVDESANIDCGPENDGKESDLSGLDAAEDDIVARLEVLVGMEDDRRAGKVRMDRAKSTERQEEGSYLDSIQVDQRLAMLRSRPALAADEAEAGAAIVNGEQIDEEYVRQGTVKAINWKMASEGILFALDDPAAPAAAAAASSVEQVLHSDSSEESGWEHV